MACVLPFDGVAFAKVLRFKGVTDDAIEMASCFLAATLELTSLQS